MSNNGIANVKPAKLGTLFALLTILYAFALGAVFGLFEKDVKGHLKAEAAAVKDSVYRVKNTKKREKATTQAATVTDTAPKAKTDAEIKSEIEAEIAADMKSITDKSWIYCKRAHMHAAGLGAIALAVIVYMGVISTCGFIKFLGSLCIGLGALGYSVFWTLAALTAPGLGSTHDAKEALYWVAQPSAGLCILGLLFALLAFLGSLFCRCGGGSEDAC